MVVMLRNLVAEICTTGSSSS